MATATPQVGLMRGYFEQWLNGLVYELFFPEELHARRLHFFDETASLAPPAINGIPKKDRLPRLQALFAQAYATDARLRALLFSLQSLDIVRIIEGDTKPEVHAT